MPSNVPAGAYPLSTPSNTAIPLELVRPTKFARLAPGGFVARPEGTRILYCEALAGAAALLFNDTESLPAWNEVGDSICYIPHGLVMAVALPENAQILRCAAADAECTGLVLQFIETWGVIAPPESFNRRA